MIAKERRREHENIQRQVLPRLVLPWPEGAAVPGTPTRENVLQERRILFFSEGKLLVSLVPIRDERVKIFLHQEGGKHKEYLP